MTRLLTHLADFPGRTWQQRWESSGLDEPGHPARDLAVGKRGGEASVALAALCALRVIAPSLPAFRSNLMIGYAELFRAAQADPRLDSFFYAVTALTVSRTFKRHAVFDVCAALTTQGIRYADLTPEAFLHHAQLTRDGGYAQYRNTTYIGHTAWRVLHESGQFPPSTPASLRDAVRPPQLTSTELVDRFDIADPGIRDLLIRYLTRRSHTIDYVTLHKLASVLSGTFWTAVTKINPTQSDLRLSAHTYLQWRDGLRLREDGKPRTAPDGVLIPVRALYADIQAWATEAPEWAVWAAPCPIPAHDMRERARRQRRVREQMADRTRVRQPLLPVLVNHVETTHQKLTALLAAATAASPDQMLAVDSQLYRRLYTPGDVQHERGHGYPNIRVIDQATGRARNLTAEEDTAFWQWAIVEVLRHTGVRIEEALELSQLSVRQYQRPNGEVIALLVIAPSKSDRERVIPMSAELFHVIARIIGRHTRQRATIPLATRYDTHERITSQPQPFLFQRRIGQRREVISPNSVTMRLRRLCADLAEQDTRFAAHFSPHDCSGASSPPNWSTADSPSTSVPRCSAT